MFSNQATIIKKSVLSLLLGLALWQGSALATPAPLELGQSFDLRELTGRPFLQVMMDSRRGIKRAFDQDYVTTYSFANWEQTEAALENFDSKIVRRVLEGFDGSKRELKAFVQKMEGTEFDADSIVTVLKSEYRGSGNIYALAHFFAMASGAGTAIMINDDNYYYNFGYKSGAEADDVKSGRSYGATPLHNANDASDVMYLNELEAFLTGGNDVRNFYETIMEFLTQTDVHGFDERTFNKYAEAAATDFIAIYTAELDRHIMVDLRPNQHPWENDLAEATFVSIFSAEVGSLMKDGELKEAPLKDFWAMSSTGSGRSGIGIGRGDRRAMQRLITAYMRENHTDLVERVEAVIGRRQSDLFRGLMEFLNNETTQKTVNDNAQELTEGFVEFLMQVQADADKIATYIEDNA